MTTTAFSQPAELKKIGTHSGTFHCDEALACYMLRILYPGAEIVRTRDQAALDSLPIVVDVGAVYDPSKLRFDHHQRGFFETLTPNHKMKLSSAGLIYKHFGKAVIKKLTNASDSDVDILHNQIYTDFIEALDGIDNGVNQYPAELQPTYHINTDLSARVGFLNPGWNEEGVDLNARFHEAMELAGKEFVQRVMHTNNSWMPARQLVKEALSKRHEAHASGELLVLTRYTLWKKHLLQLEQEMKLDPLIKYVVYQDEAKAWRIQAVPVSEHSFVSRKPLPEAWRGIRDEELSKLSGIPGGVFVHASGFIGGNKTFEGAVAMAVKALEMPSTDESAAKKQKVDGQP